MKKIIGKIYSNAIKEISLHMHVRNHMQDHYKIPIIKNTRQLKMLDTQSVSNPIILALVFVWRCLNSSRIII